MHIEIEKLDKYLRFLGTEVSALRNRSEPWATHKAEMLQEIGEVLRRQRQEQQMTGIGGEVIG